MGTHVDHCASVDAVIEKLQQINDCFRKRFPSIQAIVAVTLSDPGAPDLGDLPDIIAGVLAKQRYMGESVPMTVIELERFLLSAPGARHADTFAWLIMQ